VYNDAVFKVKKEIPAKTEGHIMKPFLQPFYVIVTCFFVFATTGCNATPASLVGTYSVEEHGRLIEFIRIEKQGDKYFMSEKQSGKWLSPVEVTPVSKADLEKILQQPVKIDFTGLGNKDIALLQVPKGWKSGTFECKTGFWLATMLGPVELHKK
jgi:hypothetical protein